MLCRCIFPLFTFVPVEYRMDEFALIGTSSENTSKSVSLDGARRMALKRIEAFVLTFSDPQTFAAAAASSAPASLSQVTESARIPEAGHLRCRFSLDWIFPKLPHAVCPSLYILMCQIVFLSWKVTEVFFFFLVKFAEVFFLWYSPIGILCLNELMIPTWIGRNFWKVDVHWMQLLFYS